ncbi:hypothetical protein T492DRAFT_1044590 [Pavlovales sp. CCMP2436]|nr:hypothetical protein T492DRAFT_1044590 [Pavlovales sp. CCMP2436]
MVLSHSPWILEPVKRAYTLPGSDGRALMASTRVRVARRHQQARRPTSDALSSAPARAREFCITPALAKTMPTTVAPGTVSTYESLGLAGRHANPRPHTAGGSNLPHGLRAAPISYLQPHVNTHEFRTGASRDTVSRRVTTPTTNRKRADLFDTAHRWGSSGVALRPSAPLAAPQQLDLDYSSVCHTGGHWFDEQRPQTVPGKTYQLIHEAGMTRVLLEDLVPALWGDPKETARRSTVCQSGEPGIALFRRTWDATYGGRQGMPSTLLSETAEQTQHKDYREATMFDGGLAFTASRTLRERSAALNSNSPPRSQSAVGNYSPHSPLALTVMASALSPQSAEAVGA